MLIFWAQIYHSKVQERHSPKRSWEGCSEERFEGETRGSSAGVGGSRFSGIQDSDWPTEIGPNFRHNGFEGFPVVCNSSRRRTELRHRGVLLSFQKTHCEKSCAISIILSIKSSLKKLKHGPKHWIPYPTTEEAPFMAFHSASRRISRSKATQLMLALYSFSKNQNLSRYWL